MHLQDVAQQGLLVSGIHLSCLTCVASNEAEIDLHMQIVSGFNTCLSACGACGHLPAPG